MDATDYLFYGFGQVVYSLALVDGEIQRSEEAALVKEIERSLKDHGINYDISHIIFELLKSPKIYSSEDAYDEGLKYIRLGSHKLTSLMHDFMVSTLNKIASSYPPVVVEEAGILARFEKDMQSLN
ncbi:MAG TPA: hypothetical protein VKZ44_00890 [Taishania sp.]|nr:hypothetical protein [Taishania sp.]